MGVIRGILLVLVCVLLFLSLIIANLFWILSLSLSYNNLQEESLTIAKDLLNEVNISTEIQAMTPLIQLYCQNNSDFVFQLEGYTFDIPCSVAMQGEDAIIEEGIKDLINNVYYTKYNCEFLECIQTSPLFIISEDAHDFCSSKFYLFLVISLALIGLTFLLTEKKTNMPIIVGSLMVVSALPFIKLDSFLTMFPDKILSKILSVFFSQSFFVSLRTLIVGIVLIIIGIIFKIFKIGFIISNFFSKFKGKEKKEEQSKDKKASRSKSK